MAPVSPFRLLDLPAELRIKIYKEVLVIREQIYIVSHESNSRIQCFVRSLPSSVHKPHLPLARVNRQVYYETIPILYGRNEFDFCVGEHMIDFMHEIGPSSSYIRGPINGHNELLNALKNAMRTKAPGGCGRKDFESALAVLLGTWKGSAWLCRTMIEVLYQPEWAKRTTPNNYGQLAKTNAWVCKIAKDFEAMCGHDYRVKDIAWHPIDYLGKEFYSCSRDSSSQRLERIEEWLNYMADKAE